MDHLTIKLQHPTEFDGIRRDTLTLRAPLVRDMRLASRQAPTDAEERELILFGILAGVAPGFKYSLAISITLRRVSSLKFPWLLIMRETVLIETFALAAISFNFKRMAPFLRKPLRLYCKICAKRSQTDLSSQYQGSRVIGAFTVKTHGPITRLPSSPIHAPAGKRMTRSSAPFSNTGATRIEGPSMN